MFSFYAKQATILTIPPVFFLCAIVTKTTFYSCVVNVLFGVHVLKYVEPPAKGSVL